MNVSIMCLKGVESATEVNCSDLKNSSNLDTLFTFKIVKQSGIISDEFKKIFDYVVDLWLCSVISYVCVVVNVITVVVFAKMGFKETMNISLTAIAVWDIVKGLCMALMKMYGPIGLASTVLAYNWNSYTTIILGYLYGIAGYVSGVMAVFVAVERCLCVSLPFTVKLLITRKVVTLVNLAISFGVVASYVVAYVHFTFKEVFNPSINHTVMEVYFSEVVFRYPLIDKYIKAMSLLYPLLSFIIISLCSSITVYYLRKASKSKVRSSVACAKSHGKQERQLSDRDRQVTKMLLVIIAVYIGSYIPRICNYVTLFTVPDYVHRGRYSNMMWVMSTTMFLFDLINATANFFILFVMSSQFKNTLIGMFCHGRQR